MLGQQNIDNFAVLMIEFADFEKYITILRAIKRFEGVKIFEDAGIFQYFLLYPDLS